MLFSASISDGLWPSLSLAKPQCLIAAFLASPEGLLKDFLILFIAKKTKPTNHSIHSVAVLVF